MKVISLLASQPRRMWRFLGIYQKPALRMIHAMIVPLVVLQLVSSYVMHPGQGLPQAAVWYHIWAGTTLCLLTVALTLVGLKVRGLHHYFPYLWGDNVQLIKDAKATLRFKVVAPRPNGLAAAVQGLGLGALWLTAFSGLGWFILRENGSAQAATYMKHFHSWVAILLIVYVIGHGLMAFMHFIHWQRAAKNLDGNKNRQTAGQAQSGN